MNVKLALIFAFFGQILNLCSGLTHRLIHYKRKGNRPSPVIHCCLFPYFENLQFFNDLVHLGYQINIPKHFFSYTQYLLQESTLQEPVLEFGKKLETTSTVIFRLRDIKIAVNEF